MGVAGFST